MRDTHIIPFTTEISGSTCVYDLEVEYEYYPPIPAHLEKGGLAVEPAEDHYIEVWSMMLHMQKHVTVPADLFLSQEQIAGIEEQILEDYIE